MRAAGLGLGATFGLGATRAGALAFDVTLGLGLAFATGLADGGLTRILGLILGIALPRFAFAMGLSPPIVVILFRIDGSIY